MLPTDPRVKELTKENARLKKQVDEYWTMFSAIPIMLWYKDTQNTLIHLNNAAAQFEGAKPEDMEGKSTYDMYPREQAEAFYQDDLEVIRSGKPKLGIVESHTKAGTKEITWLQTGKVPILSPSGEITGVIAFATDITKQQVAQEALAVQNQKLERIQQFVQQTLNHLSEAMQHGGPTTELTQYLEQARKELDTMIGDSEKTAVPRGSTGKLAATEPTIPTGSTGKLAAAKPEDPTGSETPEAAPASPAPPKPNP